MNGWLRLRLHMTFICVTAFSSVIGRRNEKLEGVGKHPIYLGVKAIFITSSRSNDVLLTNPPWYKSIWWWSISRTLFVQIQYIKGSLIRDDVLLLFIKVYLPLMSLQYYLSGKQAAIVKKWVVRGMWIWKRGLNWNMSKNQLWQANSIFTKRYF